MRIRPAEPRDLGALGALAGQLVRAHHAVDAQRFMFPDDVEDGYRWWLGKEMGRAEALVLVAEDGGEVLGYAYARHEERDWNALLDEHVTLHDIVVSEAARRRGVGQALLVAVKRWAARRAPRLVLHTMIGHETAQRLFERAGFRRTMVEMTAELDEAEG